MPTREYSRSSSGQRERGVILPLIAFVTLGVLTLFIVLGIDASVVKYSAVQLRAEANQICSAIVSDTPSSTMNAIETFAREIDAYQQGIQTTDPRLELSDATLMLPTLAPDISNAAVTPYNFDATGQDIISTSYPTHVSAQAVLSFCGAGGIAVGTPVCTSGWCAAGGNCGFQGELHHNALNVTAGNMVARYPLSIFNNLIDVGNTAGCEMSALVRTYFSGTKKITARAIFWRPAKGPSTWSPGNQVVFPNSLPMPGLTVAIATEMTTDATDSRFTLDPSWTQYQPTTSASFTALSKAHTSEGATNSTLHVQSVDPISSPTNLSQMLAACINPATLVRNAYLTTLIEFASRHGHFRNTTEILHINPQSRSAGPFGVTPSYSTPVISYPSLVVPFGADIASRQFQLPYVFYFGGSVETGTPDADYPSQHGIDVRMPIEFGRPISEGNRLADGYLNIFSEEASPGGWPLGKNNDGLSVDTLKLHTLLASQLRYCYHLYSKNNTNRFYELGLYSLHDNSGTDAFEPDTYRFAANPSLDLGHLRNNYLGLGDSWDQACPWMARPPNLTSPPLFIPWTVPSSPVFCGSAVPDSGYLSASELVGTLGTTQSCPFQVTNGLTSAQDCVKPQSTWNSGPPGGAPPDSNTGSFDLRADVVGALSYIAGITGLPIFGGASIQIPAINPPGIHPMVLNESVAVSGLNISTKPFDPSNYNFTSVHTSAVLLVLHQRINAGGVTQWIASGPNPTDPPVCTSCTCGGPNQSEYCRIRCLVTPPSIIFSAPNPMPIPPGSPPLPRIRRPIMIAYFPTTSLDADIKAVNNLVCAFGATTERDMPSDIPYVQVFAPNADAQFQAGPGAGLNCHALAPANEAACFKAYWRYLLTERAYPDPLAENNIFKFAKRDFLEKLTTSAVRY